MAEHPGGQRSRGGFRTPRGHAGGDPCQTVVIPPAGDGHDRDEAGRPSGAGATIGTCTPSAATGRRPLPGGCSCGTAAAVPAWILATDRYTATALLELSANERQLVFQTADRPMSSSFDMYKATQQQLLVSDIVLVAALRNPEAANLAVVPSRTTRSLAGRTLRVDFPGNAEIMRVSLTGPRPKETAVLVRAVVNAYMNEVVNAERQRQTKRLDELNRLFAEKEAKCAAGGPRSNSWPSNWGPATRARRLETATGLATVRGVPSGTVADPQRVAAGPGRPADQAALAQGAGRRRAGSPRPGAGGRKRSGLGPPGATGR